MKRAIILGHNYATRLSLARSAKELGFEVYIIATYFGKNKPKTKPIDAYSLSVDKYFYTQHQKLNELRDVLLSNCATNSGKSLLIPSSDFTALAVDSMRDELSQFFHIPGIKEKKGLVEHFMKKDVQKELLDTLNIKNSKYTVLDLSNPTIKIPNTIPYPCFPKAAVSNIGGKVGMRKCSDQNELQECLKKLKRRKCNMVMVEQYLNIKKEYALIGYSDENGIFIPGILDLYNMAKGDHVGVAISGRVVSIQSFEEILKEFKNFIHLIGFKGIFDIDFFLCEDGFYFGELNLRVGASIGAYEKAGINMVQALASGYYKDIPPNTSSLVKTATDFVNERICLDSWLQGEISGCEMNNLLNNDNGFLFNVKDIEPKKAFEKEVTSLKKRIVIFRIKKIIKRILKR